MRSLIAPLATNDPSPEDTELEHGRLMSGLMTQTFSTTTITSLIHTDERTGTEVARDVGRVRRQVRGCCACELRESCSSPVPMAAAPVDSLRYGVAILGEAPGAMEDTKGVPFVGQAGRYIRLKLPENGEKFSWLNAVSCRPPGNRTPSKRELKSCRGNLLAQLDALKPKHLLVLGGIALSVVRPDFRVSLDRGYIFTLQQRMICLSTFHPSAVLRNRDLSPLFDADIAKFLDLVNGRRVGLPELGCRICGRDASVWDRDCVGYCWEHNRKFGNNWKQGLTGTTLGVWSTTKPRRKRGQEEGMELDDRRRVDVSTTDHA